MYESKVCLTCKVLRPARSKHCRICNRCVARFDHHCAWINSDVGSGNLWKFLIFLFSTGAVCNYCSYLCCYVLYGVVHKQQLLQMHIRMPDGGTQPIPYNYIFQYLAYYHGAVFGLGAFCGLISLVLYGFFGYHCYLVAKNTTTSETFKWDDLQQYVKQREKLLLQKERENSKKKNTRETGKRKKGDVQQEEKTVLDKGPAFTKKDLVNTYNGGVVNNFYEVFFYQKWKGTDVTRLDIKRAQ